MDNNTINGSSSKFEMNSNAKTINQSQSLFHKIVLSNGVEVYDFDEEAIMQKMEELTRMINELLA